MYKDSERSGVQIRRKNITAILFILFLEFLFIIINQFLLGIVDEGRFEKTSFKIESFFLIQMIFFIVLNCSIYMFYRKYLKKDLTNKLEILEKYLNDEQKYIKNYLTEEKWSIILLEIIDRWQSKNIKELDREREILNQILAIVEHSILVFNSTFELILKNDSLNFLFKRDKGFYYEIFEDDELKRIIKEFGGKKKADRFDIYLKRLRKSFEVTIKITKDKHIMLIKDTTHNKAVIDVQKKFVSNVSHELKTPLTNIKGYLIALEDVSDQLKPQFMSIIKSNVEKMENIVSDFLSITKIESSNIINKERVKFKKIKDELEEILRERIEKTQAKINYELNLLNREDELNIDFDKILMILKNLVENALIYKRDVIPQIDISIIETKNRYKFGVKDNGVGIPANKLDKIFERFYRVDKARTSNRAGTGLGLAIVKEIIERYNGEIEVKSKENKGTLFIFTILK